MVDDALGKNPLAGELDSIWKIPKPGAHAAPQASAAVAPSGEEGGEEWNPLEPVAGAPGQPANVISDEELSMASAGTGMVVEEIDHTFEDMVQMVGMRLETEMFGVDIMKVQEIIRVQEVTRVPRTENYVRGVVNLRGKVIPVISLRERFSFPAPEGDAREARIMIVNTLVGTVGFEVDAVTEVFRLPKSSIVPPPPTAARLDSEYIVGVGTLNGKLLVVLNLDRLLSGREE